MCVEEVYGDFFFNFVVKRRRQKKDSGAFDPMDPSSYSDAPRGKKKRKN